MQSFPNASHYKITNKGSLREKRPLKNIRWFIHCSDYLLFWLMYPSICISFLVYPCYSFFTLFPKKRPEDIKIFKNIQKYRCSMIMMNVRCPRPTLSTFYFWLQESQTCQTFANQDRSSAQYRVSTWAHTLVWKQNKDAQSSAIYSNSISILMRCCWGGVGAGPGPNFARSSSQHFKREAQKDSVHCALSGKFLPPCHPIAPFFFMMRLTYSCASWWTTILWSPCNGLVG